MPHWVEVRGAARPLWVENDECRLPDRRLAFANESTPPPALPDWFQAPPGSLVRETLNSPTAGPILSVERRSMRSTITDVLAFYEGIVKRAGMLPEPCPIAFPAGVSTSARNSDYLLSVGACQHKGVVFWSVSLLSRRHCLKSSFKGAFLSLISQTQDRMFLRDEASQQDYWAPRIAVRDSEPPPHSPSEPRIETLILWSGLPHWAQFRAGPGAEGTASRRSLGAEQTWAAALSGQLKDSPDPQAIQESWADDLDTQGFDLTGKRVDYSYHLSVCGSQWTIVAHSQNGERADATLVNTLGHISFHIRYSPKPGTPFPE